ncbi:MAG: hypothetical protein FWE25_08245 [Lachnospiraceae bacterium]|nr:hypothetical protein [Lachnospiraceae bacterium]
MDKMPKLGGEITENEFLLYDIICTIRKMSPGEYARVKTVVLDKVAEDTEIHDLVKNIMFELMERIEKHMIKMEVEQ